MTIIINELEIVNAPPAGSEVPPQGAGAQPQEPSLSPTEITTLLERRTRQQLRLFAH